MRAGEKLTTIFVIFVSPSLLRSFPWAEEEDDGAFGRRSIGRDVATFIRDVHRRTSSDAGESEETVSAITDGFIESTIPPDKKCRTADCVELAHQLRQNVNPHATPCDDFYDYACGRWRNITIPNHKLAWGPLSKMNDRMSKIQKRWLEAAHGSRSKGLERVTRRWYRTCMNESAMEANVVELISFIAEMGGWHAAQNLRPNWTVHDGIMFLQEKNVLMPFYKAKIVKDDKNVSRNLVKLYQPSVMFAKTPYYYNEMTTSPNHRRIIDSYLKSITSLARLLGLSDGAASRFAETAFGFEKKLAKILVPFDSELILDARNTYNLLQMRDLAAVCPNLDLQGILGTLSKQYFCNEDQDILVFNTDFFARLSRLLNESTVEELNNYMVMVIASSAESFLPRRFRDVLNDFRLVRYGYKEKYSRWYQCARKAPYQLAFGAHFVEEYFSEESREYAQELIDDVLDEFILGLNNSDWLDDETKEKAIQKMEKMVTRIGYPSFILDEKKLEEFYSSHTLKEESNLLRQRLDQLDHAKVKAIESLMERNNRSEWFTNPIDVNAYYHRIDNSITFPAGILQPPLFKKNYPDYHNFGSMGYVMAHEMVHAFDHNGAKYDSEGNLRDWMSSSSKKKYGEKTRCIADFYSSLEIDGRKINGNLTLGENIADIAGLKYAFKAYETQSAKRHPGGEPTLTGIHVSPQRTFFLSFAAFHCKKSRPSLLDQMLSRKHAPPKTRVNGAVSQSRDFARVYDCPPGSKMNPINKCNIF